LQVDKENLGGKFYPVDVTAQKVEEAAKKNSEILSPYTIVEKDSTGNLIAIKYSDKYKNEISQIIKLLQETAKLYEDNGYSLYSAYLLQLTKDLQNNNYDESEKMWLQLSTNNNVDIRLGPMESYQDRLFGSKKAFQANLRISDKEYSKELQSYIETANAVLPSPDNNNQKIEHDIRIDHVIAMGGWHAEFIPRTSNYPGDLSLIKYGVKILVYTNNIKSKQKSHEDIINKLFKNVQDNKESSFDQAFIRLAMLHEVAETASKRKYADNYNLLQEVLNSFVEVQADVFGVKIASTQVLKGVLTSDDYRYLVLAFISRLLRGWIIGKDKHYALSAYGDGHKLAFNFLINSLSIKITSDNLLDIDLVKVYSSLDRLSKILDEYLINGDVASIKTLFREHSSEEHLNKLEEQLYKIVSESK